MDIFRIDIDNEIEAEVFSAKPSDKNNINFYWTSIMGHDKIGWMNILYLKFREGNPSHDIKL